MEGSHLHMQSNSSKTFSHCEAHVLTLIKIGKYRYFIMTEIENKEDICWAETFIEKVRTRPAIFNKTLPEHANRNILQKCWNEISQEMTPDWDKMCLKEKSEKEKHMKNRWRNFVTCFKRELKKQKGKSGNRNRKRRKYVHFEQLSFLLPNLENMSTDASSVVSEESVDLTIKEETILDLHRKEKTKNFYEDKLHICESRNKEVDEDKSFLLSLLPSFKKMNDTQKLEVKKEFLSTIINRITVPSRLKLEHSQMPYCANCGHPSFQETQNINNFQHQWPYTPSQGGSETSSDYREDKNI